MIFTANILTYTRVCIYIFYSQHITIFLSLIMQRVMYKHNYMEDFFSPKKEKPKLQKYGFIRKLYHTMNIHLYLGMAMFGLNQWTTVSVTVMLIPKKPRKLETGKCLPVSERWKIYIYIHSKYEKCKECFLLTLSGIKRHIYLYAEVRVMEPWRM